jgi:ribosomal protein S18 acetylase RimI-like enzyme
MQNVAIREYDPNRDVASLRRCFVELQEYERDLEPSLPVGERVADAYLAQMLDRCTHMRGAVFVAEVNADMVGFVCVWGEVPQEELDEAPAPYAYVSDLVVLRDHRRRGIGRALLARAEEHATACGTSRIKIGVLSRNVEAARLYRRAGFREYRVELAKMVQ